jgi:hypothetical protein
MSDDAPQKPNLTAIVRERETDDVKMKAAVNAVVREVLRADEAALPPSVKSARDVLVAESIAVLRKTGSE